MSLAKPSLPNVSPGQPITAQGWNALVKGVLQLFDGVNAFGTGGLDVAVQDSAGSVTDAVVVGVPASGEPVLAVPPHGDVTSFRLTGLTDGAWTVVVVAKGYATATAAATVPASAPLVVPLTASTASMPNLVGMAVSDVLAALTGSGIAVDSILDVFGADISKAALPPERAASRVLVQYPAPGDAIVAASAAVRLVIAANPNAKDASKDTKDSGDKTKEAAKDVKDVGDNKRTKDISDKVEKNVGKDNKDSKDVADKVEKNFTKDSKDTRDSVGGGGKLTAEKLPDKHLETKAADAKSVLEGKGFEKPMEALAPGGGSRRVFIPSEQRPVVGQGALDAPRDE